MKKLWPSTTEGARTFTETPTGMKIMGVVTRYKLQRVSFKATHMETVNYCRCCGFFGIVSTLKSLPL